ncbi:MAG: hypothetical protein U9Q97_10130 [Acidobacteriota bacterium]|nr:hypothetical protein [Acidobacteriota bacterium]
MKTAYTMEQYKPIKLVINKRLKITLNLPRNALFLLLNLASNNTFFKTSGQEARDKKKEENWCSPPFFVDKFLLNFSSDKRHR